MTEEGLSSPFFNPRLTSCFPCLNSLIFSTDLMFHSSWGSWKGHPHSHFHLLLLHFCSLTFPAYLQLSAILSHPQPPAWRKHPGFLAGKPKHGIKPKLCPCSPSSSVKLKAFGSGGSAGVFALSVSGNFYKSSLLSFPSFMGYFWDYLTISCWYFFQFFDRQNKEYCFLLETVESEKVSPQTIPVACKVFFLR